LVSQKKEEVEIPKLPALATPSILSRLDTVEREVRTHAATLKAHEAVFSSLPDFFATREEVQDKETQILDKVDSQAGQLARFVDLVRQMLQRLLDRNFDTDVSSRELTESSPALVPPACECSQLEPLDIILLEPVTHLPDEAVERGDVGTVHLDGADLHERLLSGKHTFKLIDDEHRVAVLHELYFMEKIPKTRCYWLCNI
jgi:hypothetical protein